MGISPEYPDKMIIITLRQASFMNDTPICSVSDSYMIYLCMGQLGISILRMIHTQTLSTSVVAEF